MTQLSDNLQTMQNAQPVQTGRVTPIRTAQNLKQNEVVEIDLLQLFFELKKNIVKILLAALIGGALAGGYSKFILIPQYRSTAMMYVLSKETTLTSLADLQIGAQLTNDYKTIVSSRPVLESAVKQLELPYSYRTLGGKITIGNPQNTRIITITAEDPDPQMAKKIADTVASTSADLISDIMEMVPPKMIESGEIPTQKSSPSNGKNAVIGAMLGALIVCAWVTFQMLMNDTVTNSEDVENYLGLSVLASVPIREEVSEEEKSEKDFGKGSGKKKAKARKTG